MDENHYIKGYAAYESFRQAVTIAPFVFVLH